MVTRQDAYLGYDLAKYLETNKMMLTKAIASSRDQYRLELLNSLK